MAFTAADIPGTLRDAYAHRRCSMYVGAGMSQGAGLPSWGGLLNELIDYADQNLPAFRDKIPEYRKLVDDPSKFLMLATELKEVLLGSFNDYIADRFGDRALKHTKDHDLLVGLDGIRFIITTNYDSLIEDAFIAATAKRIPAYNYRQVGSVQRHLLKQEFFIFKAHGDAETVGEGIILTEQDYRKLMFEERAYQSLLATMFTMTTMVFVGASMADPELRLLLQFISSAFQSDGPPHFAVMAEEEMGMVEMERWRKDFNVQFIPISSADNYADLTTFLTELAAIPPA